MSRELLARAIAHELPPPEDGGGPPEWILLMPAGELLARDGRRWVHDDPAPVLAATRERAGVTDLVIDYEHQTDLAPENGQPAPAAGWVRELEARAGEIWGRVEWSERAAAHIAAREYRYISPTFAFDPRTKQVKAVHRAALTNSPAFDMPALARDEGDIMTPEQLTALAAALGLAETATAAEMVARARELSQAPSLGSIATALGLAKTATADEVLATAKTRTAPNPGEFVPRAEFDRVASELTTIQSERTEERATAAVDDATTAGKVAPAQREWALGYARSDFAGFQAYAAAAPVIVNPTRLGDPPKDRNPDAALDADELAVCAALGVSADAYKASRTELAGRGF